MTRFLMKAASLAIAIGLGACSGEALGLDEQSLMHGAGDGKPVWKVDPCANPNLQTSPGVKQTKQNGVTIFIGTDKDDVIVGTDGPNVIWGNGGDDVICGGNGDDEIHGGDGDDYINGGAGNDFIAGGAGDDVIHGGAGGDEIHGGDGDDILMGDLLDDKLWGDDGDDLLIGGHGTDEMHGGNGNDYFRGDTGNDLFDGGGGHDVVSFMTAMPPGDRDANDPNASNGIDGVVVDFTDPCVDPHAVESCSSDSQCTSGQCQNGKCVHDGCAYGDGKFEPLDGIEVVIGSPYNDHFISNQHKTFFGGFGDDVFDAPTSTNHPGGGAIGGNDVLVAVDDPGRDLGVIVVGTQNADDLAIHPHEENGEKMLEVDSNGPAVHAGAGCTQLDAHHAICKIPRTLRYVAAYGGDGGDHVKMLGVLPRDFTAHINGGKGDDTLEGGDEPDVLFSGVEGSDHLYGNDGDDALLSESEPEINELKLSQVVTYKDGADWLDGGKGNDQLVADFPCGGHDFIGGDGIDIAGFARSGDLSIAAQLAQEGDNPSVKKDFYGRAYNPQYGPHGTPSTGMYCTKDDGTKLHPGLEILEGSSNDDELWGNDHANVIWGRKGNDVIHGLGGDDELAGLEGDDEIWGDDGNDRLEGGPGFDLLYAADGQKDVVLCGPGGGRVKSSDSVDEITGCKY